MVDGVGGVDGVDDFGGVVDAGGVDEAVDGAGARRPGNRIALENIRMRLQLAFGGQAGVAMREVGEEFETTLYFPREKMQ